MSEAKCPGCAKPRNLREPCIHCGATACGETTAAAAPMTLDEIEALDAMRKKRVPSPTESMKRFSSMLDDSPVFAPSPLDVLQPLGGDGGLKVDMEAQFEVASAPADAEPVVNLLFTLLPEGPPIIDPASGPTAHIVLALDLSASMNHPDKYPVLTEALAGMLYSLKSPSASDVLVSLVVFAYGSATLLRRASAKQIDPRALLGDIDRSPLRFGRYTDVVGALKRAGGIAQKSLAENKAMPVRIYLLTDGKPQDMDGAREVLKKIALMPIDVDGLAFGADADVRAMQELVSGGRGGTVKHVRADTLSEAFGRIAEVSQRVVANRALFDLELASGVVGGEASRFRPARHRYGDSAFVGGTKFSVDLGTMESGRPYTLLFELRLPRGSDGVETEVGRATLRLPGFGGPRVFERHLAIARHAGPETTPDPEVVAAREVVAALAGDDPEAMLRALRVRRRIYEDERRDRHVLGVIDKAIAELEERGTLAALSAAEHAALLSHTCTAGGGAPAPRKAQSAR
jgi:hypothetical protein